MMCSKCKMYFNYDWSDIKSDLTKADRKFLKLFRIAGEIVLLEDIKLLKELAKY